jgi:hypothetical protein
VNALRARHQAEGLTLSPQTARPLWRGERFDLGYAIDVLRPQVRRDDGCPPSAPDP